MILTSIQVNVATEPQNVVRFDGGLTRRGEGGDRFGDRPRGNRWCWGRCGLGRHARHARHVTHVLRLWWQ